MARESAQQKIVVAPTLREEDIEGHWEVEPDQTGVGRPGKSDAGVPESDHQQYQGALQEE